MAPSRSAGEAAARLKEVGSPYCEVHQSYGMTEMSPVSHAMPRSRTDIPLNSVGLMVPNMQRRIVDPLTGDDIEIPTVGVSEPGELLCRGPNVMVGYLGNDQATLATVDGFPHTGDITTVSAEGFVTVVDRLKELIKYEGYQGAPAELEALLLGHPQIADAAVIGVIDANGEEVSKAFLKLQPEATFLGEDVMIWVAERVAPHKKVRRVEMIDFIPKSASGKILRRDLRSQGALVLTTAMKNSTTSSSVPDQREQPSPLDSPWKGARRLILPQRHDVGARIRCRLRQLGETRRCRLVVRGAPVVFPQGGSSRRQYRSRPGYGRREFDLAPTVTPSSTRKQRSSSTIPSRTSAACSPPTSRRPTGSSRPTRRSPTRTLRCSLPLCRASVRD